MTIDESQLELADSIIASMRTHAWKVNRTGIMLGGEAGIGKTTFVKMFAKLLGLNLILFEVPHIVEEHILNIPFIVFKAQGGGIKGKAEYTVEEDDDENPDDPYRVVLSDSHLANIIKSQTAIPDEEYVARLYAKGSKSQADALEYYEAMGGTQTNIPKHIRQIRKYFKTILFIDEYLRTVTPRIRNMLRTILNGKIGLDLMPPGTYTIYASNLEDEGLDPIPFQQDFQVADYQPPSREALKSYLFGRHGTKPKDKKELDIPDEEEEKQPGVPGVTPPPVDSATGAPMPKKRGRPPGSGGGGMGSGIMTTPSVKQKTGP